MPVKNKNRKSRTASLQRPLLAALRGSLVAVVPVAAVVAAPAHAAQTGEINGYIVDDSGTPTVGASVTITSPQMLGEKKIVTNGDGEFRFPLLDPGVYEVTVKFAKYRTYIQSGVVVGIDAKVSLDVILEPASPDGGNTKNEIKVRAAAPLVDTSKVARGTSIRPELTDKLATGRTYQDAALLAAGTVNGATASGNPSFHGGTPFSNQYLLDGINITDPTSNTFSSNFNFDAIAETQVITGGMDAEYGYSTGGVVNIVTKSGGDDFTVDGSVYWAPAQLQLLDPGETNNSNDTTINLAVGGPIIRKQLWFFLSGQYVSSTSQLPPLGDEIFPGVSGPPPRTFTAFYGMGKLKWQPLPWQKFTLVVQGDPTTIENEEQDPTRHPNAERSRFQGGVKVGATSETTLSDDLFWKTQLAYTGDALILRPASKDLDTPGRSNQGTGTNTINDTLILDDLRYRLQFQSSLSYFMNNFFGDHEWKAGVDASLTWNPQKETRTGGRSFIDNGIDAPGSSIDGIGDPFRVEIVHDVGGLDKTTWGNVGSLYLQDAWKPVKNLTVRAGVRFDSSRLYQDALDGGGELYNFNVVSPRLGFAWDPMDNGKTVIRGGVFQYSEVGFLTLSNFVGRGLTIDVFEYNPLTEKYDIFVRQEGGANGVQFSDEMKAPTMREFTLGFQHEIFEDVAISADVMYRRKDNMFEDREINVQWNQAGDQATGYNNGKPEFIFFLDTPDEAFNQYVGLDLSLERAPVDGWSAQVSYTLSQLTGTVEDLVSYSLDNPRQRAFENGYLLNDVRHRAIAMLSYDLPLGFQVGAVMEYQSGRPFSKLFLNNFYGDFLDRRAARGFDPKDLNDPTDDVELRLPDTFSMDLRASWALKELTGQNIVLLADIFNVFNTRPVTSFESRDLPAGSPTQFGDPLTRGGPLNAQLALRYQF